MEFKLTPSHVLALCTLFWKPSDGAELSSIPGILLKPIMYFNRTIVAPIFDRPDYICIMNSQEKDKLCELVFSQKDMAARYQVQYDTKLDKNSFNFKCHLRAFNCYINNYLRWGLSQNMLLCPVINSETGERVTKYLLSTNYSSDRIIIFEAGSDDRVVAVVAMYGLDLDELHEPDNNTEITGD